MGQLFDELKRRNVIRVAVAYAVVSWVLLQIADLVLNNIEAPAWVMQTFMLALALGFPLVLGFSWAFELTPEGLKREKDVDRSQSVTHRTAKKLDQLTIVMLVLVVVFVFAERRLSNDTDRQATTDVSVNAVVAEKSIAVLAFEDLSQEGDQAYFAEGLSEELLNLLAKIPDLQVAGRTSSFAFKGQRRDLREIGEILNVAHVLEGSVRKAGNNIRVTAQLVNTETGFHLFSETYNDELSDIFKVQDAIAQQITAALKTQLLGDDAITEMAASDIRAYELYLEARQKIHTRNGAELQQASALLDASLLIDPNYPPAIAQKALVLYLLSDTVGAYGDIPAELADAEAMVLLDRALALDPDLAEAHAVRGLILPWTTQGGEARARLERALEINPNLDDASLWLSTLLQSLGHYREGIALLEKLAEQDPLFSPAFSNLARSYVDYAEYDKATALIDRYERAGGDIADVSFTRASLAGAMGDYAEAIKLYRRAIEMDPSSNAMRLQYGFVLMTLGMFDQLADLGIPGFREYSIIKDGRPEEAIELAENMQVSSTDTIFLQLRSFFYGFVGRFQDAVDLIEPTYGSLDSLLTNFPGIKDGGYRYMYPIAHAYRELGQKQEFEKIMRAIDVAITAESQRPTPPRDLWDSRIFYAALMGDADALLHAYQKFIEHNGADADPFGDPLLAPYRSDPRFRPVIKTLLDRANAERVKLGLSPVEPPLD